MKRHLSLGCGAALLCASCLPIASSPEGPGGGPQGPLGPRFAETATIQEMLVGRTTLGSTYAAGGEIGNAICEYFAPDGTITSVELVGGAAQTASGSYVIDDDMVCVSYAGGGESCRSVVAKRSSSTPNVWGGDFYDAAGTLTSRVVTADGNQVDRCH